MAKKLLSASTIFELALSLGLIILSIYLATADTLTLPGRLTANIYSIEAPATYIVAGGVFICACTLALLTLTREKFKNICIAMFALAFLLFVYGFYFY